MHLGMGRKELDTAMKFSKDGAVFLCGKTKMAGTVCCGEEKEDWDIT